VRFWRGSAGICRYPTASPSAQGRIGKAQAISWLKESAIEHVAQMHAMVTILEAHGLVVDRIRTKRPGYVIYEDEHQVAAYPFADTPT
jgi:hypothetical protein